MHTDEQPPGDLNQQAIRIHDTVDPSGFAGALVHHVYAELRPLTWQQTWTTVADPNWDNNGGTCGFLFETTWNTIVGCHAGTFVTNAYVTTDPFIDVTFLIDNLNVAGKHFSSASDNGNGDNETATFTPDLLPFLTTPLVD